MSSIPLTEFSGPPGSGAQFYAPGRWSDLVVATGPKGPVLAGERTRQRPIRPGTFTPLLSRRGWLFVRACTIGWAVCFLVFWVWWLQPDHLVSWTGLAINSVLLFYLSYLPSYFLIAVGRLNEVNPELAVPDVRVAFVVTRAPSEPWTVARATLTAMLGQRFDGSYDVWLCDEDPSEEILTWCEDNGVAVSTRRGVTDYHRAVWPGRTKCKEGNLAYFYDRFGYRDYDVVAQLDCDHVPEPGYLSEMVRPFADPAIGYVGAPSVCDSNAAGSWSGRGRLHREGTFHGAFQVGHQNGLAPLCIGSHYAVRTRALQDIGGLGPELAEDFSTTFLLSSAGWQGAFAHRAEAHGDGPHTFAAMVTQEFQWSRSLVAVLYDIVPTHLRRMPWSLRCRFMFVLMYYPLLALASATGLVLPAYAAITGKPWVDVNYFEFLLRWSLLGAWLLLLNLFLRRQGLLRPRNTPLLSWENWLYTVARWPYIFRGIIAATAQKLRPGPVGFKVTPKVRGGLEPLPLKLVLPYVCFTVLLAGAAVAGELSHRYTGYIVLSILGSITYAIVTLAICYLHGRETAQSAGVGLLAAVKATVAVPISAGFVALAPLLWALALLPSTLYALAHPPH